MVRGRVTASRGGDSNSARETAAPGPPLEDRLGLVGSRAGLLALGSSYSPRPSRRRARAPVELPRVSSPITVTGSRRLRTAFPLGPSGAHLGSRANCAYRNRRPQRRQAEAEGHDRELAAAEPRYILGP